MNATVHAGLNLTAGGEKAHAVPIVNGSGANLWLGSVCITAASAEQFEELADAAKAAAEIQRAADQRDPATVCDTCKSTLVDGACRTGWCIRRKP